MIETKSQIAILEKEIAANPGKQQSAAPAPDSAAGMIQQQIADYQRRIADTPAHEEAIAAVNRDYANPVEPLSRSEQSAVSGSRRSGSAGTRAGRALEGAAARRAADQSVVPESSLR